MPRQRQIKLNEIVVIHESHSDPSSPRQVNVAGPRTFARDGYYDGRELRPFEGREGSNDFAKHPSLVNGKRIYRRGVSPVV
jgi:hypothetical protein